MFKRISRRRELAFEPRHQQTETGGLNEIPISLEPIAMSIYCRHSHRNRKKEGNDFIATDPQRPTLFFPGPRIHPDWYIDRLPPFMEAKYYTRPFLWFRRPAQTGRWSRGGGIGPGWRPSRGPPTQRTRYTTGAAAANRGYGADGSVPVHWRTPDQDG